MYLLEDTETTDPTYLRTEKDLEKWENTFETIYVSRLEILNDQVLREKMQIVLDKSQHSDISILRSVLTFITFSFTADIVIGRSWEKRNISYMTGVLKTGIYCIKLDTIL